MSETFRQALRHDQDCPPVERLIEAMEHGAEGHAVISAHVRDCPACQTELALYRGFDAGEVKADEREAVDYIVRRLRGDAAQPPVREINTAWWERLAAFWSPARLGGLALAAAAVLLTFGLSSQFQLHRQAAAPLSENDAMRAMAIQGIHPQGEVSAFPDRVQWDAVPGATEYEVTLSEVDRNVLFHKKFTTPALDIPAETRKLMVPGKTALLTVSAVDSSGRELARSGKIRIFVRPQ